MVELVKKWLAWIETHSTFPANMPQKSARSLKLEVAILNLCCRTMVRLNTIIEKTIEKCSEFYKGIHLVHNQSMILTEYLNQVFPVREEHLKNLQERMEKGEENISSGSKLLVKKTSRFGLYKHQVKNSSWKNL